ncbi:MAG TPA: amidohydrolase family protein [Sphingomicrobium sp.]|nr:amidohydrolase family protein [Sphingomicrobium sp.]
MESRRLVYALLIGAAAPFCLSALQAHQAPSAPARASTHVPKEQLLKPGPEAEHYVVVSDAGKHGDMWRWPLADGRIAFRHSQSLRGWITETDATVRYAADGRPTEIIVRGITPSGDAAESYVEDGGNARWKSIADSGAAPVGKKLYLPAGGPGLINARLIEHLVAAGPAGVELLPSGRASLTMAGTLAIQGPAGPKTVKLAFMRGILSSPVPVWLDENNKYFADVGWLSLMPAGFEANAKAMRDMQDAATAAEVRSVAHRFLTAEAKAPVLFDNVQLFDADKGVFVKNQAVLARDGKIAAVGRAGSIALPAGARRIDGRGKTLVPGIWDSHMHIGDDWDVLANVANGMTSFRSPGTMLDRAQSVTTRRASGDLLMGEPFISAIVDRKDPLAAQGSMTVTSEAETIAAVRKIKDAGLWGVKFYTSMNPAWIAPAAAEAKRLGLHVHGHVPATMRPLEAVRAGYDELTHLNFVVMQAMPKEIVDKANTAERIAGPARVAKDVDWNAPEMRAFIAELKQRGTIVDPTLVIFESMLTMDGGTPAPAYVPYMGIISPVLDRAFKAGGYPLAEGFTRDDYRKSYGKMRELVGLLHKAGVTVVAGTDGSGIELVRELELYQQAGMTPAQALQTATIIPARVVGADKRTGSIVVGKEADLVLVDGDVSRELGALRRVVTVVSDGYVMDAEALRKAAGYTGKPK